MERNLCRNIFVWPVGIPPAQQRLDVGALPDRVDADDGTLATPERFERFVDGLAPSPRRRAGLIAARNHRLDDRRDGVVGHRDPALSSTTIKRTLEPSTASKSIRLYPSKNRADT